MQHTVYSDEEIAKLMNTLAEGVADFQVIEARTKNAEGKQLMSAPGNPMVALNVKICDCEGNIGYIKDWLVLTKACLYRFKSFWEACNRLDIYKRAVTEDEDYLHKEGKCYIKWTDGNAKYPKGSMKITKYLKFEEKDINTPVDKLVDNAIDNIPPMTDDDLPF